MKWLGDHPYILVFLAIAIVFLLWKIGIVTLSMLGATFEDGPSGQTMNVENFDLRFRCIVCATEVKLTRVADDEEDDFEGFAPPKHCREEMVLVVEAPETVS